MTKNRILHALTFSSFVARRYKLCTPYIHIDTAHTRVHRYAVVRGYDIATHTHTHKYSRWPKRNASIRYHWLAVDRGRGRTNNNNSSKRTLNQTLPINCASVGFGGSIQALTWRRRKKWSTMRMQIDGTMRRLLIWIARTNTNGSRTRQETRNEIL